MATIKFVLWNVEWMNDLFGPNDQPPSFKPDTAHPQHHLKATVRKRRDQLSGVIRELDPDVLVVVEGPNRTGELQLFCDSDLPGTWKAHIQVSKGMSQNIGLAVRTDRGLFDDPPFKAFDTGNVEEFNPFHVDTDDDEITEQYEFERRPLYAELNPAEGRSFRILGLHLKSKGIFKAYEWSKWWAMADSNRRKILAQAAQIRMNFIEPYLAKAETGRVPLIITGDINDGPGMDASEKRLFGSGVERLMGSIWSPDTCLSNALFDSLKPADKKNLNFEAVATTRFSDPIFNNTVHNEWIDHILYARNHPENPFGWVSQGQVHSKLPSGDLIWKKYPYASDHYPVSAVLNV